MSLECPKSVYLQRLIFLSLTVFCLYTVQELSIERIEGREKRIKISHTRPVVLPDEKEATTTDGALGGRSEEWNARKRGYLTMKETYDNAVDMDEQKSLKKKSISSHDHLKKREKNVNLKKKTEAVLNKDKLANRDKMSENKFISRSLDKQDRVVVDDQDRYVDNGDSGTEKEVRREESAPENKTLSGNSTEQENGDRKNGKIWITMGLCWGENAHVYGKDNFPYAEAAKMSISIWHKLTHAQVILQIAYNGNTTRELHQYRKSVEKRGARVFLHKATELSCVLTSQLVRLLAFTFDFVKDEDIIITSDVDAFVMSEDLLKPLKLTNKRVWIWRYALSYTNGYTFMLPFIGAYRSVWRSILWYEGSLTGMLQHYSAIMDNKDFNSSTWDIDQHIVTRALLEKRMCSLPEDNSLWSEVNLHPKPFRDDECWHGSGIWEDCNNKLWHRNAFIKYEGKGCKWWHFYPDEGVEELQSKYREIIEGRANKGVVDSLIRGFGFLKKNYVDNLLNYEKMPRPDPSGELEIWSDHTSK